MFFILQPIVVGLIYPKFSKIVRRIWWPFRNAFFLLRSRRLEQDKVEQLRQATACTLVAWNNEEIIESQQLKRSKPFLSVTAEEYIAFSWSDEEDTDDGDDWTIDGRLHR